MTDRPKCACLARHAMDCIRERHADETLDRDDRCECQCHDEADEEDWT